MFDFEVSSIESFRNLVKALSVIVERGNFLVDESQIKLVAMDPSHVAMVDFELPKEFFKRYLLDEETKLTLNINELLKFLDRVEKDEQLEIKLDKENMLLIQCKRGGHTRRFLMPVLEPVDEEVPSPNIFFKSRARMLTQSLRKAIRDASLVSEHVKLEITNSGVKISAAGDMGSASSLWEKGADDIIELKSEEDSNATFTLSYLQDIVNTASVSSEVAQLELSTDMPIKMSFELPQGRLVYYLAPCIGV
ncbi:proliferating cell nuclear antigen (pcna) [Candidatus Bathyarchaeota archaeon]|nr:proliferating cell nuclear antigen (pcna) [Candidatus Bathyarchaeota archaeon]MBS7630210.1 proliferating cell nuclear antigen (pcna) [Candidatus Bathyarchaeota archaeon]